jgi:hypothetical protein
VIYVLLFVGGVLLAFPIYYGVARLLDAVVNAVRNRQRKPAAYMVRILDAKLEGGRRVSFRPLLTWKIPRDRSWALVLLKEGPREPTAGDPPVKRPFTEPLDDPEVNQGAEAA